MASDLTAKADDIMDNAMLGEPHVRNGVDVALRKSITAALIAEREADAAWMAEARRHLTDARENGLIYWEPQTTRGVMTRAAMFERIDAFLAKSPQSASSAPPPSDDLKLEPVHLKMLRRGLKGEIGLSDDMMFRVGEVVALGELHRAGYVEDAKGPFPPAPASLPPCVLTEAGRRAVEAGDFRPKETPDEA